MPDYLSVLAVEPEVDGVPLGDDDHTYESLYAAIEQTCDDWDEPVRVLFTSPWEAASLGVFVIAQGEIDEEFSELSLKPDKLVTPAAKIDATFKLRCEAGDFVDAVSEASGESGHAKGNSLSIPFRWQSVDRLTSVMQVIAPQLKAEKAAALVAVDGSLAQLTLHRKKGVTVAPVFYWFEDKVARAMARAFNRPIAEKSAAPIAGDGIAVLADALQEKGDPLGAALVQHPQGSTPLTSGSAQSRIDKVWDASSADLIEALGAPENEGQRFEKFRIKVFQRLVHQEVSEAVVGLLQRLPLEAAPVRAEIYSGLTRFDQAPVYAALAQAFETDSENAAFISTLVWRQRGTVDLLVARLVTAWTKDKPLAKRLLAVLREEYISVHPGQLGEAPRELVAALSGLVKA